VSLNVARVMTQQSKVDSTFVTICTIAPSSGGLAAHFSENVLEGNRLKNQRDVAPALNVCNGGIAVIRNAELNPPQKLRERLEQRLRLLDPQEFGVGEKPSSAGASTSWALRARPADG
jgi:hypothetical protein